MDIICLTCGRHFPDIEELLKKHSTVHSNSKEDIYLIMWTRTKEGEMSSQ